MTTTQTSEEDQAKEGRYELVYNPRLGRYVKVNRSNSGGRRCGCDDERFWASEDWRKLESMETFEAPNTGPVLRVKRRGKL